MIRFEYTIGGAEQATGSLIEGWQVLSVVGCVRTNGVDASLFFRDSSCSK